MKRRAYKQIAVAAMAAVLAWSPAAFAQETIQTLQSAEEGGQASQETPETPAPQPETPAPQPETPAPQPETPAPQPETPAPQPETPAPQPETPAPQPETPAPQTETVVQDTSTPETSAPQTNSPETNASEGNHSTAIPENPTEKKLNQTIVDAGETDEGFEISINGGESVVIEPDKSFREVVNAIAPGYNYVMDYIRPHTRLREPIEIEKEGSIKTIFDKFKVMPGAACDIVLYLNDGKSLWLNMKVQGSLDTEDAQIIFTSLPEEKVYTVTYDANGGSLSGLPGSVRRNGEWYSHFDGQASKDGAYFCGWFDGPGEDAVRVFPTDPVTKDTTLYAHFSPYGKEVAVFDFGFATEGDSGSLIHHLIFPRKEDGTYEIVATPHMERDGMVIVGWKDGSGETVDPTKLTGLTESRSFTAIWGSPEELQQQEEKNRAQEAEAEETETEAQA